MRWWLVACFGTNSLSEPMLTYHFIDIWEETWVTIQPKFGNFHIAKWFRKCCLQLIGYFCLSRIVWSTFSAIPCGNQWLHWFKLRHEINLPMGYRNFLGFSRGIVRKYPLMRKTHWCIASIFDHRSNEQYDRWYKKNSRLAQSLMVRFKNIYYKDKSCVQVHCIFSASSFEHI